MQPYQPPSDIIEVLRDIAFEEALEPDDPRRVDTREARGSQQTLDRLGRKFGLFMERQRFSPQLQKHVLFFGHPGAGKTTELKYYCATLQKTGWFLPVEVDVAIELDRHNLQFSDLLMAMAHKLLEALTAEGIRLPSGAIAGLENWFAEQVRTRSEVSEFSAELNAGGTMTIGIPLLTNIFAKFSSAFKANATYKDELRRIIRNTFAQFSEAFNHVIRSAETALSETRNRDPARVFFFIDGTDRLGADDRRSLFVDNAELLLAVNTLAVYTAPIGLKYEGGLTGRLDADPVLPMIKLQDGQGTRCEAGWLTMRDILLRRADQSLFESEDEITRLIEASGGHPRELLRLLQLCCEFAADRIDAGTVVKAVAQLASEYRRQLEPEDYTLLASIDRDPLDTGNDTRVQRLLYCLALLEYNDGGWRRSHPVIRTLEGYRRAVAAASGAA
jgi:hypothetical protein